MATFRKKLTFNLTFTFASGSLAAAAHAAIPITPTVASGDATPGDLFDGLLEVLPFISASTPNGIKRQNSIAAWFVQVAPNTELTSSAVLFVRSDGSTPITGFGPEADGALAIYSQRPQVLVSLQRAVATGGTTLVDGVLYVQKQHSIEV